MKLYRAGYILRVSSFENDGDAGNTEEIQVDTLEQVNAIIALTDIFGDHGNIYDDRIESKEFYGYLAEFWKVHGPQILEIKPDWDAPNPDDVTEIGEFMMEFSSELGLTSEYFARQCDGLKIYRLDQDVEVTELSEDSL